MTRHLTTAAILSVIALTGCDDSGGSYACDVHEDCLDAEVCFSNRCRPAYSESYRITLVSASYLPVATPEGDFWDPTGEGIEPDPYLVMTDQDGNTCTSSADRDSTSPRWDHACGDNIDLEEDTLFSWVVYDDDDEQHEEPQVMVESAEGDDFGISVEWIRAVTFAHASNGATIYFRIDRR